LAGVLSESLVRRRKNFSPFGLGYNKRFWVRFFEIIMHRKAVKGVSCAYRLAGEVVLVLG